ATRSMLNSKAINELLSRNRDGKLCKRWYLMTPNGTLLAYSRPVDINDLRKQAAITAICWQEHRSQDERRTDPSAEHSVEQNPLHTLIVESETSNIIMRQIQKQLLLVLEGGVPPRRAAFVKTTTAEAANGTRLLSNPNEGDSAPTSNVASDMNVSKGGSNALKLQRRKLDALADIILGDFEATGFRMPEGSITF
ncbi:hypothetical protein CERZMDRAFT_50086, partial [Cercospora zeae-maydis SCOH1-5]